ncbi:hypothetical protein [Candidimonas sp. SYP-B2681]|nr:hypothetical protein [Candidimonas sp. SYP-B2681]
MDAANITRELLRRAKQIVRDELDAADAEAVLPIFYRLCMNMTVRWNKT